MFGREPGVTDDVVVPPEGIESPREQDAIDGGTGNGSQSGVKQKKSCIFPLTCGVRVVYLSNVPPPVQPAAAWRARAPGREAV